MKKIKFSQKETKRIITLYKKGKTFKEIANKYNVSQGTIQRIRTEEGISVPKRQKYNFDTNIFNKINTKEKAYWMGFLTADAGINSKDYSLQLEITQRDIEHLRKFKDFLKASNPITNTRKNCCRIAIHGKQFIKNISKHGLVSQKTLITETPTTIPLKLLSHFYRGILDGDGWITSRKQSRKKNNQTYYINKRTYEFGFSSGSEKFINQIHQWICDQINQKRGYIIHRNQNGNSCYKLTFGGNNTFIKISKILYKNTNKNIHLDRKYEKIQNSLNNISF